MKIKLYSNDCPKCKILKERLDEKEIEYEEKNDTEFLKKHGIFSFPAMEIEGRILKYYEAIKWLKNNKQEEKS